MKLAYTLFAFIILFTFSAEAQETIYKQDFNTATSLPSDFDPTSATWAVASQALKTSNPSSNDVYANKLKMNNVAVKGYVTLKIKWASYRTVFSFGNDVPNYAVTVTYTTNINRSTQTATVSETNSLQKWGASSVEIFLPDGTTSVNYSINVNVNTKKGDYYALDDLVLEGTREQTITPMPVELISFKGAVQGNNAKLTWATAQEVNNDKFVVERSQDGKVFAAIGEVKGHGNSSTRLDYSFTDTNPAAGTNYYRLRQLDIDGTEDFSKVVALQLGRIAGSMVTNVYPTMASFEVTISLGLDNAQVTITNANGHQLKSYTVQGRELVVPVQHLHKGVYFVVVTDGNQRETQRFVKN